RNTISGGRSTSTSIPRQSWVGDGLPDIRGSVAEKPRAEPMKRLASIAIAFAAVLGLGVPSHAQLEIDVTEANIQPVPIAIQEFGGDPQMGPQISQVITDNLRRSGLFAPIDPASFIERGLDFDA